jgi:repressor LexA
MAEFKDRLNQALRSKNMSAAELSRISKVNEGAISQYRKGVYKATQENLDRLAKALGVSVAWLMGYDVSENSSKVDVFSIPNIEPIPKMKKVPRLGTIACGEPILAEQNIDGYDLIEETIKCDFTLKCKGDSMINARIFDGDIVYIRQQSDVDDGEIAAILINNEATLKKVFKTSDKLVLRACNPMYDDLVYTNSELENIRILGKAVAFTSVVR